MPVVFVHGVNNRRDDGYRENEAARNGFLRDIVAEALKLPPDKLTILSPYWGDNGVKFAWNMAVMPDSDVEFESFGADPEADAQSWTNDLVSADPSNDALVDRARKSLVEAVDLVFGATLAGAKDEDEAREVAQMYKLALAYAERHPHPDWLDDPSLTDDNFADVLAANIEDDEEESFGAGGFLDRLREGVSRVKNAIPKAGSDIFVNVAREKLNATISRFAGDAFVYLKERGTVAAPGTIVKIVLDDLKKAIAAKTDDDSKLVVIAHSFGGEIMYDILTHFASDLQVDVLVTVGSQVGLFEEMKLYIASGAVKVPDKVAKPANVAHWLNVFDTNDVLSFRAAPVFSGTSDFEYNTGYSSLQAHGGYFLRPSFYMRLAARLKELVEDN
ncbi:hypothetical protein GOD90_20355 [Sinorhizobium medicae]|nr:hypothetical protein [Sinorhizobium medicae]MDX0899307.1 hypothetical protein [Sinorhizobium medicae]MDX1120212.1 hypothetical protein [Sinorhizobium medicae]MDX1242694.1 hypothetical protein [Sinorhizobium medicae]